MSSTINNLEREDHGRDAAFSKAMHGSSVDANGGLAAMFSKSGQAKQVAVDEYFKHWDNKAAANETEEQRAVCLPQSMLHGSEWRCETCHGVT